ncbi:MAG TPA: Stp1/IreP family PP2C-type Ser/Thr phosphatase [Planctomycetaceae bacterium]|nr:Stp1/IreP family PP2C-type Ser/Thr phosphatase [Planctomycetaceae bacterium]
MSETQTPSNQREFVALDADASENASGCSPLAVHSFGLTDCGKVRSTNEDHFLIAVLLKSLQIQQTSLSQQNKHQSSDKSYLFVVADGMGGRAGGEVASALAIDSVESFVLESLKWFAQCKGDEQDRVLADFQRAVGEAGSRVQSEAAKRPGLDGMGTTLTLAYSLNDELFVAHAGDSRCYLCRNGALHRLTRDHTLVSELVRRGGISADEAKHHKLRHIITNVLGGGCPEVEVELHKLQLEAGDVVLLCSDGLTEMLSDERIGNILAGETDPENACRRLIAAANDQGGRDNITAVVAHFGDAGEEIL